MTVYRAEKDGNILYIQAGKVEDYEVDGYTVTAEEIAEPDYETDSDEVAEDVTERKSV